MDKKKEKNLAANGAVMRTSILGVPCFHKISNVIKNTKQICKVTHADPRCLASCVAVTVAVALMLQGETDLNEIIKQAQKFGEEELADDPPQNLKEFTRYMNCSLSEMELDEQSSIGYTFKCLGSAFYALRCNDFEAAITNITLEAGDSDTNGAVAGALLGCKLGYSGLPKHWLSGLVHGDWLIEKVEYLCDMLGI